AIAERGPMAASDFDWGARRREKWWGWNEPKRALEALFWTGRLTTATRRNSFERVYGLPEKVLPRAVTDTPAPTRDEAQRQLLMIAARAMGIATHRDLRDYFRMPVADAAARNAELVEAGRLIPVRVKGWREPAYLHPDARRPRKATARALLSPFDNLIWYRERTERLFGLRYRIEIYTPAEKRTHGYYVLPFLEGEALTARVDLKADRQAGVLLVQASHAEPGASEATPANLAEELRLMAGWLGLGAVRVMPKGDLAERLEAALG
ncbi:MAG TPA: crosslink repair DNA glycosylase YcaQ family protein, partial [Phenylobacterium sp.]